MGTPSLFFANRTVVIATMHRKEQAISPLLTSALGVHTLVPPGFNTDAFGTFTRDTERPADQLTTARIKAAAALDLTGETLAIASEGSFGPHREIPFMACDHELVLLCDRTHQLEIVGEVLSTETNYKGQTITSIQEALTFAKSAGFPEHGMVIMRAAAERSALPAAAPKAPIAKGLTTEADLVEAVDQALSQSPERRAHIETDMRALYNPTRMKAIAQATEDLIQKIEHACPQCSYPGFSLAQRQPGLPCSLCGAATLQPLSAIYRCAHCQYKQTQYFPDSRQRADPAVCFYCNP